ncbi:MAG TPA: prepilin peptidase [Allocoleopsis sp.]
MNFHDAVIVIVSGLSAFFDLRIRKIPNWLIITGLLLGVILNALRGTHDLVQSVIGFIAGIAVLIVPFALGWIGAGDVKFFGVVGAILGASWLPRVFFYSALAAGLIAFAYLAVGIARLSRLKEIWIDVKTLVLSMGRVLPEPVRVRTMQSGGSVPWGVAFAAGTIIAYYFDPTGRWAGF